MGWAVSSLCLGTSLFRAPGLGARSCPGVPPSPKRETSALLHASSPSPAPTTFLPLKANRERCRAPARSRVLPAAVLALGAASGGTCQCLPWQGSKAQGWGCSPALAYFAECLNKSLTPTRKGSCGRGGFCITFAAGWKLGEVLALHAELSGRQEAPGSWHLCGSTLHAQLCTGSGGEFVPLLIEHHFWQSHPRRGAASCWDVAMAKSDLQ